MALDNLSYLALEKQKTDFPAHFHETYCISLILGGVERLDINGQSHFSESGSITVTHPYEVHAQPVASKESGAGFITIYLSPDLMKFYSQNNNSSFVNRRINDSFARKSLIALKTSIENQRHTEEALERFIQSLSPHMSNEAFQNSDIPSFWIHDVKEFIDHNITGKILLDELARVANLNKFGFGKAFKAQTGMSPMNYVLMQKVFAAKKHICYDSNLTSIAYQFDFTDMAHFSNTFKRFVGISPKEYKTRLF